MARRLFFVDHVHSGMAELCGEDARHLTRVLRVQSGQRYEISDNHSLYLAEVSSARKEHVEFRILEKLAQPPLGPELILCAALFKFDRFEWMIEKATELGVTRIIPFAAARSEKGLDSGAAKRAERWRRIAVESSQQCRRYRLPEIQAPVDFQSALHTVADLRFFFDEAPGATLVSRGVKPFQSAAALVGPEGGWTEPEREQAVAAGWKPVSVARHILRAETAAIAALAVLGCFRPE